MRRKAQVAMGRGGPGAVAAGALWFTALWTRMDWDSSSWDQDWWLLVAEFALLAAVWITGIGTWVVSRRSARGADRRLVGTGA